MSIYVLPFSGNVWIIFTPFAAPKQHKYANLFITQTKSTQQETETDGRDERQDSCASAQEKIRQELLSGKALVSGKDLVSDKALVSGKDGTVWRTCFYLQSGNTNVAESRQDGLKTLC